MIHTTHFFNDTLTKTEEKILDALHEQIVHEKESGEIGYYLLPENSDNIVEQIENFAANSKLVQSGKLKNVVVMGIGGSTLGAKAIDEALKHTRNRNSVRAIFLENGDPIVLKRELKSVQYDESIFIMISKSGSTIETTSVTKYLINRFDIDFKDSETKEHFLTVTDKDSPLDRLAAGYGLHSFNIPKNVGGRFSVLSAVGLFPLKLLGYDIRALLDGAQEQGRKYFSKTSCKLEKKAYRYYKYAASKPINVLFSYASTLREFNAWYVQLWGESLGKIDTRGESVGLTPIGLVGSVDQHSFLQLIVQGPKDKTVTFIKIKDFGDAETIPDITLPNLESTDYVNAKSFQQLINSQCQATLETLKERGVSVDLIEVDTLDEASMGALILYFELLTSCVGVLFGVNTYDQPGVEFGKKKLVEMFA